MKAFHPIAEIFPLLDEIELEFLAADIVTHGLREPITLHPDGSILDGRNRARACERIGVEPTYTQWDGRGSPVDLVLSLNLHRRHLTISQRAIVAARLATLPLGVRPHASFDACGQTEGEAAKLLAISRMSVQRGRAILGDNDPEIIARVTRGDLAISAAYKLVRAKHPKRSPALRNEGEAVAPQSAEESRAARLERIRAMAAEGYTSRQIAAAVHLCIETTRQLMRDHAIDNRADRVVGPVHHHNANRILERMAFDAETITADVDLIDFATIDPAHLAGWLSRFRTARTALSRFIRTLEDHHNATQRSLSPTAVREQCECPLANAHAPGAYHATRVQKKVTAIVLRPISISKIQDPVMNHREGVFWIIDSQHRIYAVRQNSFTKRKTPYVHGV